MIIARQEESRRVQNPAYSAPSRPHIFASRKKPLSQRRHLKSSLAKLPLPALIVVVAVILLASYLWPDTEEPYVPAEGTALEQLDTLQVQGRAPKTGYSRDEFGHGWLDPDGNGCDARNDILARDLEATRLGSDGCIVLSGTLDDAFTGKVIDFIRGPETSAEVQIDHVVALSDAWQKGAQQLTDQQRQRFANDPLNLLAVDGPANQQKSDADAATWLPANKTFRCEFVAIQTAVKAKYDLWVTPAEYDAIFRQLQECPDQPAHRTPDELPVIR